MEKVSSPQLVKLTSGRDMVWSRPGSRSSSPRRHYGRHPSLCLAHPQDHLIKGEFDAKFMVSHRVDVSEFAELYNAFDKRWAGVNKVFVQTKHSNAPSPGYPQLSSVKDWPQHQL